MSAAGRRAIIAATKKRWAAIKAAKAAAEAPAPAPAPVAATPKTAPATAPVPVKKRALTEAGRKALSVAMKKRGGQKEGRCWHGKSERLSESRIQSLSVIEGLSQV